jgi:hypothetical protein
MSRSLSMIAPKKRLKGKAAVKAAKAEIVARALSVDQILPKSSESLVDIAPRLAARIRGLLHDGRLTSRHILGDVASECAERLRARNDAALSDVIVQLEEVAQAVRSATAMKEPPASVAHVVMDELIWLNDFVGAYFDPDPPELWLKRLKAAGVLTNLRDNEQLRLAEIVADFAPFGTGDKRSEPHIRYRRAWSDEGHERLDRLRKKLADATQAIRDVQEYVAEITIHPIPSVTHTLDTAIESLSPKRLDDAEELVECLADIPAENAMLTLYDFFVSDCGLEKHDAEIRVCRIGNQLWNWNVKIVDRIDEKRRRSDTRLGCEAVRKAVERK